MVAAARLRRAQENALANKPYADKMRQVITDVAANAGDVSHPLLEKRDVKKRVYLVLASDKGLAGAYASNVFKEVAMQLPNKNDADLVTVGRKAREYFSNRGYSIAKDYSGFSERPTYEDAKNIAVDLIERFIKGECDEIVMVYTRFISAINSVPTTVKLLPFAGMDDDAQTSGSEYIYEPSAGEVLGYLLPQYLITMVYAALLQASASELSSRMTAMSNATDNAQDLIQRLDLHYNKVRQAGITREINEIVSGAEALK